MAKEYGDIAEEFLDTIYMASGSASLCSELGFDKLTVSSAVAVLNKLEDKDSEHYSIWYTSGTSRTVEEFVKAYRFPPMAQLTRKNFFATANAGKLTFMALVDPSQEDKRCGAYSLNTSWLSASIGAL